MPRMPNPMMTATTINTILTALLACAGFTAAAEAGVDGAADTGAPLPHFGQNLAAGSRGAPQELQNAIGHLTAKQYLQPTAEYIACWDMVSVRGSRPQPSAVIGHAENH